MDTLTHYRTLIKDILTTYVTLAHQRPAPDIEPLLVFDDEHGNYLWLTVGWVEQRRVHGITVHVRLRAGKIWIEQDWTEEGIATDLVRAGISRDQIVLAFQPADLRHLTEFAGA